MPGARLPMSRLKCAIAAAARQVKDLLVSRVRQGATIILTTHILEVAERLADPVDRGPVPAFGDVRVSQQRRRGGHGRRIIGATPGPSHTSRVRDVGHICVVYRAPAPVAPAGNRAAHASSATPAAFVT